MVLLAPSETHASARWLRYVAPMKLAAPVALAVGVLLAPSVAHAWGYEGHEIVAAIARARLTPQVRAKVDAILAGDPDTLTAPDMLARATWADAWRGAGHRETATWHFVDQELGHPDLSSACFGKPTLNGTPASAGPAQDCVVDKIDEFQAELASPSTPPAERLLALKYLLHFVGDVHQPLHASDHQDRGGNCVRIGFGGPATSNLHSFWDTGVLAPLGSDPVAAATKLNAVITPVDAQAWSRGTAADWARESYEVARTVAYTIGSPAGCSQDASPAPLPAGYAERALAAAEVQLEKSGVRLAYVLNTALANIIVPSSAARAPSAASASSAATAAPPARSARSLQCSAQADSRGLHGEPRREFRSRCKREGEGAG